MLLPGWELAGALTGARSAPYNKIHGYEVWEGTHEYDFGHQTLYAI